MPAGVASVRFDNLKDLRDDMPDFDKVRVLLGQFHLARLVLTFPGVVLGFQYIGDGQKSTDSVLSQRVRTPLPPATRAKWSAHSPTHLGPLLQPSSRQLP